MFRRRRFSLVFLIYIIIGIVVAWEKGYITVGLLKVVLSALLAIFLWFLVLLGISLHHPLTSRPSGRLWPQAWPASGRAIRLSRAETATGRPGVIWR